VDQYLARQGRLTLIENTWDIQTKIRLARWNRPNQPENHNRATLQSIVHSIFTIMDMKHPPACVPQSNLSMGKVVENS
jgi:hypothetical protein